MSRSANDQPHTRQYHQALLEVWHSGTGFMPHRYRRCGFSGAGNCCCGRHEGSQLHVRDAGGYGVIVGEEPVNV